MSEQEMEEWLFILFLHVTHVHCTMDLEKFESFM